MMLMGRGKNVFCVLCTFGVQRLKLGLRSTYCAFHTLWSSPTP